MDIQTYRLRTLVLLKILKYMTWQRTSIVTSLTRSNCSFIWRDTCCLHTSLSLSTMRRFIACCLAGVQLFRQVCKNWRRMLKVSSSYHHDHRFNRVPPTMPSVPHHPVISHGLVRPIIVVTIQVARVTPVREEEHKFGTFKCVCVSLKIYFYMSQ